MFLAIRKRLQDREDGFTLIELLVVVIIIGILAAIAIPTLLSQREKAWIRAVQSDLRNATVVFEEAYSNTGAYPAAGTAPAGLKLSSDVTYATHTVVAAVVDANGVVTTPASYCLQLAHGRLPTAAQNWRIDTASAAAGRPVQGTC